MDSMVAGRSNSFAKDIFSERHRIQDFWLQPPSSNYLRSVVFDAELDTIPGSTSLRSRRNISSPQRKLWVSIRTISF